MPPKAKLHKFTGKSGPLKPTTNSVTISEASTSSGPSLTPEQEQKFEVELCWCIQQLQLALKSGKLNSKQVQDHTKTLNTLMSNTAPIIKKRQVMRSSFGDYRAKMAVEEKKAEKSITLKVKTGTPSKKSVFIKKAIVTPSDNNFRFNFTEPEQNNSIGETAETKISDINNVDNKCDFVRSDNSFRFNFGTENT